MPLPIRSIEDNGGIPSFTMDVSFLAAPMDDKITKKSWRYMVTDQDASLLMRVWMYGEKEGDNLKVSENVLSSRDYYRLKTNNLIFGEKDSLSFTQRGKDVIKTMTLGEENAFAKNKKEKSYHEILASANKKGKSGFRVAQNSLIDLRNK